MRWQISRSVVDAILAAAAADPEREICGLLFGGDGVIDAWSQTNNVAEHPNRRFEIDPRALFAALKTERAGGPKIVGYVHSHPNGDFRPSRTDLRLAARDDRLCVIAGAGIVALWRLKPNGFVAVPYDVMTA